MERCLNAPQHEALGFTQGRGELQEYSSLRPFDRELFRSGLARGNLGWSTCTRVEPPRTVAERPSRARFTRFETVAQKRALERLVVRDRPRVLGCSSVVLAVSRSAADA
jgi:hypothetical protein